MKVLHVTSSFPRYEGDYRGSFIKNMCSTLKNKGVNVSVLSPRGKSTQENLFDFSVKRFPYFIKRFEILCEHPLSYTKLYETPLSFPYLTSCFFHCLKSDFDILHAHFLIPSGFVSSFVKKFKNKPLLVTCHGSDVNIALKKKVFASATKFVIKRANCLVAVSEHIRDELIKHVADPKKIELIPLGVNTGLFNPKNRKQRRLFSDKYMVGTLSSLLPSKRIIDLLKAALEMKESKEIGFLIGGRGPEMQKLKSFCKKHNLKNVNLVGPVSRDTVPEFISQIDTFVLPSEREGLSISLQEAMAMGCVPIVSDSLNCRELIMDRDTGLIFKLGNIVDLKEKILEARNNKRISLNARKLILKKFDSNKTIELLIKKYESLIDSK